ncbi:MAG: SUMF1/EgtB/PvdO family nonheme iron enzyme [Chloroflexota bacterium]
MSNLIGKSLGRYHILEQLGEGGMATVYKAYDTRLETEVAVKVIRTEELSPKVLERALKRFEREAKSLAKLTHANIVKVTDYGEQDGSPYLVMTYLPGGTLKEKLGGKPMPWQEAVKILLPIARALDYAHRQNMIHRDVKPSNILITADGDPLLTDFGIAKIIDEEATLDLTGTSAAIGTPEYMAPEQATAKFVDKRADIYAFGIVLYEMVTGRRPFTADTPMAVLIKHATEPLPRPTQFVRDLPPRLEQILIKALAKNPDDRYQSMSELASALESFAEDTKTIKPVMSKPPRQQTMTIEEKAPIRTQALPISDEIPKQKVGARANPLWLAGAGVVVLVLFYVVMIRFTIKPSATLSPTFTPFPTFTPSKTPTPIFTLTFELGIGSTWTRPADGMTMMYVPEGSFEMGSNNGNSNEKPIHTVYLDAYWMDQTEVTNAMYQKCVNAAQCDPPYITSSSTRSSYYGNSQYADYPVIHADWNDANAYCQWAGARLPTEAEWEKAARGTDGRTYPWGEGLDCDLANYYDENKFCVGDTSRVGSYPNGVSPYGLFDMAGNVSEWVMDWYDYSNYYSNSPSSNPQGPSSGLDHVFRGGSWQRGSPRSSHRGTFLGRGGTNYDYEAIGFRCALSR